MLPTWTPRFRVDWLRPPRQFGDSICSLATSAHFQTAHTRSSLGTERTWGKSATLASAEPGGERFDRGLTNEQRREARNLLLLCHDHHVVTNDETEYSVQRLRDMKQAHEERFERGLASMVESSSINIVNSSVSLGGAGGAAPGAGGGGGALLGRVRGAGTVEQAARLEGDGCL
jgi:hypothetical protein